MGYQLPDYDPRLRAVSAPVTDAGPMANADAFGANRAKDLFAFGGAVGDFGRAITHVADIKQHRVDQTKVRESMTQAKIDYDQYEKSLLESKKGLSAKDIEVEAQKWFADRKRQILEGLDTNRQRDLFNPTFDNFMLNSSSRLSDYGFRQVEQAEKNSRDAENDLEMREASGKWRYNDDELPAKLDKIHRNIEINLAGQDENVIKLAKGEADRQFHANVAQGRAADNPQNALDYLSQEKVIAAFAPAELKAMRERFISKSIEREQKSIVDAGVSQMIAMARTGANPATIYARLVDEVGVETARKVAAGYKEFEGLSKDFEAKAGKAQEAANKEKQEKGDEILTRSATSAGREAGKDVSETDARDAAYAQFPEKYAKIYLDAYKAEKAAIAADKAADGVRRDEALGKELEDAGYDATRMPSWAGMSISDKQKYLDAGNKLMSGTAGKTPLNESLYLEAKFDMSEEEVSAIFADPDRRAAFAEQMGGATSQQFKDIAAKATKLAANPTGGRDGGKITTLDTDLNNVKRSALNALAATGRTLSPEDEEKFLNQTIEYARKEYEAEMERAGVDDVKALPLATRNRIQAQAVLTYEIDRQFPIPNQYVTKAEAWAENRDIADAAIVAASLPPDVRVNYTGTGGIRNERGQGGPILMETNIDPGSAAVPESVRQEQLRTGGTIIRDLVEGGWMLVGPVEVRDYASDGSGELVLDPEDAATLRNDVSQNQDAIASPLAREDWGKLIQ